MSHVVLCGIFDNVEGRGEGEKTKQLFCETTTSQAKIKEYETVSSSLYEFVVVMILIIFFIT